MQSLLTDEQLANSPVLILGNKIDRPGAAGESELRNVFGLYGQTTGKVILLFSICYDWVIVHNLARSPTRFSQILLKFALTLFNNNNNYVQLILDFSSNIYGVIPWLKVG